MFRDDQQASRALALVLSTLPGLQALWTSDGPTPRATELRDAAGGVLSSGERVLLLAAFTLWSGDRTLALADVLELDGEPLEALLSLILALERGADSVDTWIAAHSPGPTYSVHFFDSTGTELSGAVFPAKSDDDAQDEVRALALDHEWVRYAEIVCVDDQRRWKLSLQTLE